MMEQIQFITTSPTALANLISDAVKKELEELKANLQPKPPVEFLTRKEVAELIRRDVSTVHNLTQRGTLVKYQIGGSVLYRREEVENAIVKLKIRKS